MGSVGFGGESKELVGSKIAGIRLLEVSAGSKRFKVDS